MRPRASLAWGLLAASLAGAPPALALDPREEQAREAFERGVQQSDQGKWAEALESFQQADRLAPSASVRYNLAATMRALGRYVEARRLLEQTLRDGSPLASRTKPALKNDMTRLLEEVTQKIARVTVEIEPASAELLVDGVQTSLPADRTLEMDPGRHVFLLRAPGHDATSSSTTVSAGSNRVTLRAPPSTVVERKVIVEKTSERSVLGSPWFWGVLGLAVAGGVVAAVALTRDPAAQPGPAPRTTVSRTIPVWWSW